MYDLTRYMILLTNNSFYGYDVWYLKNGMKVPFISSSAVRDAVKYASLDDDARKIWDDPKMTKAQKYQNIPQIDISTYVGDYLPEESKPLNTPISILDNGDLRIHIVYSASREEKDIVIEKNTELYNIFLQMIQVTNPEKCLLAGAGQVHITPRDLIFHESAITDVIDNEKPSYGITMNALYQHFKKNPNNCYVPYRRGWSRLLNIQEVPADSLEYVVKLNTISSPSVILQGQSCITYWDGKQTKVENHGVQVERMMTDPLRSIISAAPGGSTKCIIQMRILEGTHEKIQLASVEQRTADSHRKYYIVQTIKGINVSGLEFDMP